MTKLKPTHPGEVLMEEFLVPMNVTMHALAMALHVPATRITEICHGARAITPDTALRLAQCLNTSPDFWMNLQVRHDLEVEKDRNDVTNVERLVTVG